MHRKPSFHALQLRIHLVMTVLILASLACGRSSSAPAKPTAIAATSVVAAAMMSEPTPTKAPDLTTSAPDLTTSAPDLTTSASDVTTSASDVTTSTSAPTPTASPTPPPEPPAQAVDLLVQNLDTGKWSEGQALVDVLSVAAGKKSAKEVFGDQPVAMEELSGLQVMVKQYLKKNPTAPEKQQLEDLVAVLAPSAERMLPYAKPEGSANLGQDIAVAFQRPAARHDEVDCQELANDGFPTPKPGQPTPLCVLYKEFNVLGKTYRIFYPKNMSGSSATPTNLTWIEDALKTSAQTYKDLEGNILPDTDVVFVVQGEPKIESLKSYAAASASTDHGKCQIQIYKTFGGSTKAVSQQLIAHEVFHCYHQSFLQTADSAPYAKAKWWEEGSAVYFSNVVYPKANSEFSFASSFDTRSIKESLLDMSYENGFFFQYMGNQIKPEHVLDVLRAFPASGDAPGYLNSLNASIPDFETFFHEFSQAYLDSLIGDSGGGAIPFAPQPGEAVTFGDGGTQPLETQPLTVTRYRLIFEKGKYLLNKTSTGKGMDAWRPRDTVSIWGPMAKEMNANCGKRAFVYAITSVTPNAKSLVKIEYGRDDTDTQCDECLIGSWQLDPITYNNYMDTAIRPPAKNLNATASILLTFTEDSMMRADVEKINSQSALSQTDVNGDARPITIGIEMTGEIVGEWSTQNGMLFLNTTPSLEVNIKINGQEMGSNGIDASNMGGNFFYPTDAYVCAKDQLSFTPQIHGGSVAPLAFWRVVK